MVRLLLALCLFTTACGPSSSYRDGKLTLAARTSSDRDGFDLSTYQVSNDWRGSDLYVFVRLTLSLSSQQGDILCEKDEKVSSAKEISSTTTGCLWGSSSTGPRALLARDRSGGLHRILVVDGEGPDNFAGFLTMEIAKVE